MTEYCWSSQAASGTSNEDSTVLTFQRTISAQVILSFSNLSYVLHHFYHEMRRLEPICMSIELVLYLINIEITVLILQVPVHEVMNDFSRV